MTIKSTTLRPGFLVSLKTSVRGGIKYNRRVLDSAAVNAEGVELSRWETEKAVTDPKEHEAARKVQSAISSMIRSPCVASAFGLICPENNLEQFQAAMSEGHRLVGDFNKTAQVTRVDLYVITGRIAPNDAEAVRAINSEVAELMATMQKGMKDLDVKIIRDSASRLRQVGGMLSPNMEGVVKVAIETARANARDISKAAEGMAATVDNSAIRKTAEQRIAFLDMDEAGEVAPAAAAPGRKLDLDSSVQEADRSYVAAAQDQRDLDLG